MVNRQKFRCMLKYIGKLPAPKPPEKVPGINPGVKNENSPEPSTPGIP